MIYRKLPTLIRNSLDWTQNSKTQLDPPPFQPKSAAKLSTNLIKAYFENGLHRQARQLFDEMPERDVVAWTAMISGYTACGRPASAWETFHEMTRDGPDRPNEFTLSSVLKACKAMRSAPCGAAVHGLGLKHGLVGASIYVDNALLDVYATCCAGMGRACAVFEEIRAKNSVSWTTFITGYAHREDGVSALRVFRRMFVEEAEHSPYSFSIAIRACAALGSCAYGTQIHCAVFKHGFDPNTPVTNSLLDMYCRCGRLRDADGCFRGARERDATTWNTLIAGSNPEDALHLFRRMEPPPNGFTFSAVVAACTRLTVLAVGRQVHGGILKRGLLVRSLPLANSLVDMYAKCGCVEGAYRVFREMPCRDLVSWTSMVIGFGSHGYGEEAVGLFDRMVCSGQRPDTVVFMAVLTACSHAGLVDRGLGYFRLMTGEYGIGPNQETYGCIVDLLGRGGRVAEAYDVINGMPFEPDESVWAAFLGACKAHGHRALGETTARRVMNLRPTKTGIYVTMANIYAAEGRWGDRAKMRRLVDAAGSKKEAGRSWVEVRDRIYSFVAGDNGDSGGGCRVQPVYQVLRVLGHHMMEPINVP